jgi:hypothetical protein
MGRNICRDIRHFAGGIFSLCDPGVALSRAHADMLVSGADSVYVQSILQEHNRDR